MEKEVYLGHFLHDDERDGDVTLPKHTINSPSCRKPHRYGKSIADDDHDAHDDELQRFSKGGATLFLEARDGAMGREHGERKPDEMRCDAAALTLYLSKESYPVVNLRGVLRSSS